MKFCMFSKMLADLSVREAAAAMKKIGFDGVDLTVRPKGHVLPEEVEAGLPQAAKEIADEGMEIALLTTAIEDADDPTAEAIFAAAQACGVQQLKLGYWKYEGFGRLQAQIDEVRAKLDGIEKLSEKYGVKPCIHIHSGDMMSALAPVVRRILEGRDPQRIGVYLDPGHMTLEGGRSGWKMGIDILADYIHLLAVKDFGFVQQPANVFDKKAWKLVHLPLDTGMVQWPKVIECLRAIGFDGWASLHSEYPNLTVEQTLAQTEADLVYFKGLL